MKILILDIETTGFLNAGGFIVEVGIVELNLENGIRKIVFDSLVCETGMTLNDLAESWIVKNSDLEVHKVAKAKKFGELSESIQKIINQYPDGITAYNNNFDFSFLEDRGIVFNNKLSDPMKIATNICKLPGKYGYKWPKVEEAYLHFFPNSNYIEKHRGADDAMHEAKIVYELYKLGEFKID